MKHNWDKFGILTECMFVDSMQILQDGGYERPGLDALCKELDIKRSSHSALEDAYILKTVCNKKAEMMEHPYGYTFGDITNHLNRKLSAKNNLVKKKSNFVFLSTHPRKITLPRFSGVGHGRGAIFSP